MRKTTEYNEEELEYIAKHPLVTLEKTTYSDVNGSTDVGSVLAAQQIKAKNASTKILFYHNAIVNYPGYTWCSHIPNSSYVTQDSGEIFKFKKSMTFLNLTQKSVRDFWVSSSTQVLDNAKGAIDGIFVDAIQKVRGLDFHGFNISSARAREVEAGGVLLYEELQAALKPRNKFSIFNALRCNGPPDCSASLLQWTAGSYMERIALTQGTKFEADYFVNELNAAAKAAQNGNIIAMVFNWDDIYAKPDGSPDYPYLGAGSGANVNFFTAAFLTIAERHSYFLITAGYGVDPWAKNKLWLRDLPVYSKRLGPPSGPAVQNGYVFTRSFQFADVVINCKEISSRITWH